MDRADVSLVFSALSPTHALRSVERAPIRVQVIQAEYQHDMAVLTYDTATADAWRFRNATPVEITWGAAPIATETFYGHVLYVQPSVDAERARTRVVCIGASYRLKDSTHDVQPERTVEQAVAEVAHAAGYSVVRDVDGLRWDQLVRTAGESLWEYLCRLAVRCGYTLFVTQTTLHFYDPVKVLLANASSSPVLVFRARGRTGEDDLLTFDASLSEDGAGPLQQHEQRLLAVDPRTAQVIAAADDGRDLLRLGSHARDPLFTRHLTQPAHSVVAASERVRGARMADRWVAKGRGRTYGDVRVRQGSGVVLDGLGGRECGLWYVHRVVHDLFTETTGRRYQYYMDVELLRDASRPTHPVSSSARARRPLVATAAAQTNRRPPKPVLVGGGWMSPAPRVVVIGSADVA